ncbi:hypothetical protein MA20_12760 [Bradyrhizobium japonicum]|uniref:Uncharacterized protein n=1 Tax=Bradyrhizobium japonicum TaxID=375 RepID=A0A0A3XY27_BRAJP|nr:hypothetical protein [Bradyrhizobium japonicum]KGT79295.1 hypothetical protein MA20_12760 [Bradyrhizobium japonicum]
MTRLASIALLALLLAGCASRGPASIAGGECRIFEAPKYEVRGARDYDQDWIDSQVEGGVGGCHWNRPARRPAAIEASPAPRVAPAKPARRGIIRRIRDRVLPTRSTPPAAAAPIEVPPAPVIAPAPDPAPPRPPRSALERLLQPRDDD